MMSMFQGLMVKPSAKKRREEETDKSEVAAQKGEAPASTGFSFLNAPVASSGTEDVEAAGTRGAEAVEAESTSTSFAFIGSGPSAPQEKDREEAVQTVSGSLLAGLKIHSQRSEGSEGEAGVDKGGGGGDGERKDETEKRDPTISTGSLSKFSQSSAEAADPFSEVIPYEAANEGAEDGGRVGSAGIAPDLNEDKDEAKVEAEGVTAVEDDKDYEFVQTEDSSPITVDGEFGQLLAAFRRSVNKYCKEIGDMNSASQRNSESEEETGVRLKELESALAEAEGNQNTASESEDFAKAEELQKDIDRLTRQKGELQSRLEEIARSDDRLGNQREKLFENQISTIETIRSLLQDCSLKESKRAEDHKVLAEQEYEQKNTELNDEEDLLRMRTEHIEQDLGVLKKEEEQITSKISSGTETLREQRNEWETKMTKVNDEIAHLEAQLKEKYDQKNGFSAKIADIDSEIEVVKAKYETRVSELEARREVVEKKQEEVRREKEHIDTTRTQLLEKRENEAAKSLELKTMAETVVNQLVILEKISERLREESAMRRAKAQSSAEDVEALSNLQDTLKVAQQSANVLRSQLSHAETSVIELTTKLLEVDNKLPALNEQKRLAVSTRNFKQAARIAAQVKALTSEKEAIDSQVGNENKRIADLSASLAEKQEIVTNTRSQLDTLETSVAREKLEAVREKSRSLREHVQEVKNLGSTDPGTFGGTVLQLLCADIESCSLEAVELAKKLGDPSLADVSQPPLTGEVGPDDTVPNPKEEITKASNSDVPLSEQCERVCSIDQKLQQLSVEVEKAVDAEQYELAAELEEELTRLKGERERCLDHIGGDMALEEYKLTRAKEKGSSDDLGDAIQDTEPETDNHKEAVMDETAAVDSVEREGEEALESGDSR